MAICSYLWCRNLLSLETNNTAFLIWKSFPACCIVFISSQCILFIYFSGSFMLETFLKCVVNFGHIFTFEVRRPVGWLPPSLTIWSCFGGNHFCEEAPSFLPGCWRFHSLTYVVCSDPQPHFQYGIPCSSSAIPEGSRSGFWLMFSLQGHNFL